MSDVITLEGREYTSAKRASEISGYARDYIGQLARKGLIGAQRVGGLWYVSMESLQGYQKNADLYQPVPVPRQGAEMDSTVSLDGKDYISASRAAKISGYNQDYIGQLARAGKILSRQIGNRWYVERAGLLQHKTQKDSLLAAVQREAVGLAPAASIGPVNAFKSPTDDVGPYFKYTNESSQDLMPRLNEERKESKSKHAVEARSMPIRVIRETAPDIRPARHSTGIPQRHVKTSGKLMIRAAEAGVALTFVIVLSYGLVTLKNSSLYALNSSGVVNSISRAAAAAAASKPVESVGAFLESVVSREIVYRRVD